MCDHRYRGCFSAKQQPIIRFFLPLRCCGWTKERWPLPFWCSWTAVGGLEFHNRVWDPKKKKMTLAVKVPCLRSLWKLYFCLHEWCFRLADPSIRQMKKRKKASSKEEPHSLILGEGGACHVKMGVSNPPVPPPFIFLISACSAYSVCLQELNKATNKIQFINKSHIQKSSLSICYVPHTRNRKWTRSAFTELQDRTSLGTWSVVTPWDCVRPSPLHEDISFLKQGKRPWGADGSFQN